MSPSIEVVRFRVEADQASRFFSERRRADTALLQFDGFLGSELAQVDAEHWVLIVRWASSAAAAAAQQVTLSAASPAALTAWIALSSEVVGFETATLLHSSVRAPDAADLQERNLAVAKQFVMQGLGKADLAVFDTLIDADVVVTTGLSPKEPIRGRAAYKQVFAAFADAWPVQEFVVDDIFASGEQVVVRFTATTVFRKDYYGVKASKLIVPLKEVHIYTLRNGKIVENIVAAVNLPFEFIMYPALKDAVLGDLKVAP